MSGPERIKRGGFTFGVWQGRDTWYAGAEASRGATRDAAIAAHLKHARAEGREASARWKAQAATVDARKAARKGHECTLAYCTGALNTPAHRATAKHRNAVAVKAARARGERV